MATSLQQITDAWGRWMDKKYDGNGVKFTASTNYNAHDELDDYHQYEVSAHAQPIVYDPNAPLPMPGSVSSVQTQFNNNSSVEQTIIYEQTESTEQSFTWSVTEDLSIGVEVSASVSVPTVADVGTKVTTTIAFSSSQGSTHNETQSWSVTQPVVAPPYSYIDASMVVSTQQYDINWTDTCVLSGSVAIWFNDKVKLSGSNDSHHLYFVKIEKVFSDCQQNNLISLAGYQIGSGCVNAFSNGVFRGGQGTGVSVHITEQPLSGSGAQAKQVESYVIPIDADGNPAVIGIPA